MKGSPDSQWTFLTNHTQVLVVLDRSSEARIRDIATEVKITERAVQRILAELAAEGFLKVTKIGRRNEYAIVRTKKLRHSLEARVRIGDLLKTIAG